MSGAFHAYSGRGLAPTEALIDAAHRAGNSQALALLHPEDYKTVLACVGIMGVFVARGGIMCIQLPIASNNPLTLNPIRVVASPDDKQERGVATLVTDNAAREFLVKVTF